MADLRDMFFEECEDLLEGLTNGLDSLQDGDTDSENINAMFRSVHSIKGGAGAFGLDRLIKFAHVFENVLDDLRSNKLEVDADMIGLLFSSSDHLADLIEAARDEIELPPEEGTDLLDALQKANESANPGAAAADDGPEEEVSSDDFAALTLDIGGDLPDLGSGLPDLGSEDGPTLPDLPDLTPATTGDGGFEISFKAHAALYEHGHDPALLFRTLRDMGDIDVTADTSGVQSLDSCADVIAAVAWRITFRPDSGIDIAAIKEVFEFVEGQADIQITEVAGSSELTAAPTPEIAEIDLPVEDAPAPVTAKPAAPIGKPAEAKAPPASAGRAGKKSEEGRNSTIRVDLDRVDRLINLVGELVISEAMLRQSMSELPRTGNGAVSEAMGQLKQLSGVLQESVMAIRAQPVRGLFQRMSRIVREAAREAGKSARLVMVGEATEVDKTVTERLVEPLTHMIRNSVDHGLEKAEDRKAAGKSEQGTIRLEAAHRSGRVVITLTDDGAGINRKKVRAVAEEKGLIRPEDDLTDGDIDNLLFRAGFSTASSVSNLSGRGVGMDVVRNEIQALGGRINLQSETGKGTVLTISLPLTLAVMEGMVVTVAGESLVVPTVALRETLQPGQADVHAFCEDDQILSMNDALVPIVDLGSALGFRSQLGNYRDQALLIIEAESGRKTALAVDSIIDQREVVIKGLEQNYQRIPGIAAATILGNGRIALIVDTDQMITSPEHRNMMPQKGPETLGVSQNV